MNRRAAATRIACAFAVLVVSALVGVGSGGRVGAAPELVRQGLPTVSGGGASFPALELNQWRADVARPPYNLSVNYTSAGSTFGRNQYLLGNVDFGVSDIPFQEQEAAQVAQSARKHFVYVPVVAGAVGFMFNVIGTDGQRITDLKLTQEAVCRMFTEPGLTWDDPVIASTNPGVPLPSDAVRPVIRADGSGTSYVFSEFCIATAPSVWAKFVALVVTQFNSQASEEFKVGRPTSNWPQIPGFAPAFASDGVANTVASSVAGRNTITYVEAGYSIKLGLPTVSVRNASGAFVPPDPPNSTVALGYATGQPDGTFRLNYTGPDPRAYFPSTYSYVVAPTDNFDPRKGAALGTFLNYAVTKGQERAEPLLYSRMSTVLVNLALDSIQRIPGAPPRPTDLAGAPPPPTVVGGPPAGAGAAAAAAGGKPSGSGGQGGGAVGTDPGAAQDPAAEAAAGAATEGATGDITAQATDEGYALDLSEGDIKQLAEEVAASNRVSTTTGPALGEVVTYLLVGFVAIGAGTFLASGARSSWVRR